jgi:hypothetical protein
MALFGKKKNETAADEEEKVVRAPRYESMAFIHINGFEGQALIKNVSSTGFCMQSKTFAALIPGEKYTIRLVPEKITGLSPIEALVDVRWVRSEVSKFETGLQLVKAESNRELERYISHLKLQAQASLKI